jgi:hypothetical protein
MQDEEQVHGPGEHGVDNVVLARGAEHHVEEVRAVIERIPGIHERLAERVLVRVGGDRRHLGEQADDGLRRTLIGFRLLVEGRQRSHRRRADRHRMGVLRQPLEEAAEVLVQHRVAGNAGRERLELCSRGQFPVDQQPRHLEEGAPLG